VKIADDYRFMQAIHHLSCELCEFLRVCAGSCEFVHVRGSFTLSCRGPKGRPTEAGLNNIAACREGACRHQSADRATPACGHSSSYQKDRSRRLIYHMKPAHIFVDVFKTRVPSSRKD
jgi:hypothetical protein